MKPFLPATLALLLSGGLAFAQTTTESQSTTTVTPIVRPVATPSPIIAPPPGTLASTETSRTVSPNGTVTDKDQTTYRNTDGVANDSLTKTTTLAAPIVIDKTTSSSTSTTVTQATHYDHSCPPRQAYDPKTEACEASN
jgi:hypothetical protein